MAASSYEPPTIACYESKSADRKKRRLRFLKAAANDERHGEVAAVRRLFFFCRRAAVQTIYSYRNTFAVIPATT